MSYPIFGNLSLGNVSGNIKLYVNNSAPNDLTGIGYNNNAMTFGVNQSATDIPEMIINRIGDVNILGNVLTGGNVVVSSTVNSTTTTTGALRVAGGAGIQGNLNIGGFSTHMFDASFNGNIQLTQTNNPLWLVSNNASVINSTLALANDVGIFYGTTYPAGAGLVISPRGAGGGIKMAINGNVGIGKSSPTVALDVNGDIKASGKNTALSFDATSDYRMKKSVQPILINRSIDLLKPVEYDLSGGPHDMGFLAHEVQEVLPFLVSGEKDGPGMQSMNYNGFIALLVKEVQLLKKENRELMIMKVLQEQQQTQINYLQEQIKILLSR